MTVFRTTELKIEAIDFGLDVEGTNYKLLVADITGKQLQNAKEDSSLLPVGWSLANCKIWKRGYDRKPTTFPGAGAH